MKHLYVSLPSCYRNAGELRPEQAPPAIAKLIDDCLNDEPHLRPTAQQVMKVLLDNKPPNVRD